MYEIVKTVMHDASLISFNVFLYFSSKRFHNVFFSYILYYLTLNCET